MKTNLQIEILPLTPERWADFEALFGKSGGCMGCWCMWWRIPNKEFNANGSAGNKEALRTLVHRGVEAGLLAYMDGVPAGWVTVAPREDYLRLKTSRDLAPVDDQPVWSIPCFYIHPKYRRTGLMTRLIEGALSYAKDRGAKIAEAYPKEPGKQVNPMNVYTGLVSTFSAAGFAEVARRKPTRPIMRKTI
jgi:GNAT superfamily N-acetyltransferase